MENDRATKNNLHVIFVQGPHSNFSMCAAEAREAWYAAVQQGRKESDMTEQLNINN